MKKRALPFLLIISAIILCFMFSSCIKEQNNLTPETIDYSKFFDLNSVPFSYNGDEGKGFNLYDDFDLDTLNIKPFVNKQKGKAELFLGEERVELRFVGYESLGKCRFERVGKYTLKLEGEAKDGTALNGEFGFFVANQGIPDVFEYRLVDNEGNNIDFVEGGNKGYLDAILKLDDEILGADTNIFSSYWKEGKNKGLRKLEISKGNIVFDTEEAVGFFIETTNNLGQKVVIEKTATVQIRNNLLTDDENSAGIYVDFGGKYAPEMTVYEKSNSGAIDSNISAEYRFKNGDILPLVYSQSAGKNNFQLMARYNGESEFTKYSASDYDYSKDIHGEDIGNYISNGTRYRFNPLKDSVELRICVWKENKKEFITNYERVLIGESTNIVLLKSLPTSISVEKVTAKERNEREISCRDALTSVYSIVNNKVNIKIACDLFGNGDIDYKKQNFTLTIKFNPECDMNDYEYVIDYGRPDPTVLSHKWSILGGYEKVFVAKRLGESTITIKSKFSDAEYSFTVNVVDPVLKEEFYDNSTVPNLFTKVDIRPYVQVRQYRLSTNRNDNPILRYLTEEEELMYDKEMNNDWYSVLPEELTYLDMPTNGYKLCLTCNLSGKWQSSLIIKNIRIIPNFSFSIDKGEEIWLYTIEDSYYYMLDRVGSFWGINPLAEYSINSYNDFVDGIFEIKNYDEIPPDMEEHFKINYNYETHTIVIGYLYKLEDLKNPQNTVYYPNTEILKINIVEK